MHRPMLEFTCDSCGKSVSLEDNPFNRPIFPKGWSKFIVDFHGDGTSSQIKDLCETCAINWLAKTRNFFNFIEAIEGRGEE